MRLPHSTLFQGKQYLRGAIMERKAVCLLLSFFLMPVFAFSQGLITLDDAVRNCGQYLQSRFPRGTRAALIAIQSENQEISQFVLNKLSASLVNNNWLTIVGRNEADLAMIEREINRHLNFNVSEETELRIGRQLGAQIIISGSFTRAGQNWQLNIQAINAESTQIAGQWLGENIRNDAAWNSLGTTRRVSLVFTGDTITSNSVYNITAGLRDAMQTLGVDLELDENAPAGTGYGFEIRTSISQFPNGIMEAEVTVTLLQGRRTLVQNRPYIIRETNETMTARRIVEQLKSDQEFFNRVKGAIR
jgi:TolB-like protein